MTRRVRWTALILCLAASAIGAGLAFRHRYPPPDPGVAAGTWFSDWPTAAANARRSGRPVLALFTGSDWCPTCVQMKAEVFDTPEFTAWARQRVVLLLVDFPIKTPLPQAQAAANETLVRDFGIAEMPTILFLGPDGQMRLRVHYQPGGVKQWLALIDGLLQSSQP